jgi:hypothetical protein
MNTITPKPTPGQHEITVFYAGAATFDRYFRKSLELAADIARGLRPDEHVLYVNVLTSELRLEQELGKICRSRGGAETRRKVLAMTIKSDDLLTHEAFIERTVESRSVRLVVVNGFEFAALTSRRRARLTAFIQNLRDFAGVDVAVGMRRQVLATDSGAYGSLAFQVARIEAIGDLEELYVAERLEVTVSEDAEQFESFTHILYPPATDEPIHASLRAEIENKGLSGG